MGGGGGGESPHPPMSSQAWRCDMWRWTDVVWMKAVSACAANG